MTTVKYSPNISIEDDKLIINGKNININTIYKGSSNYATLTSEIKEIIIEEGVETLGDGVFRGFTKLEKVVLPKTLKEIGDNAFNACTSLKEINFPPSLEYIGEDAFLNCNKLEYVELNEGLKYIEQGAFDYCNLESFHVPSTVTKIYSCLVSNESLKKITVSKDNPIYSDCDCNVIYKKETNTLVQGCKTSIIPSKTKIIGVYAFFACDLNAIIFPPTVKIIEQLAFWGCESLKNIELNEGLEFIGKNAFGRLELKNEEKLNEVIFPSTLKEVRERAFENVNIDTLIINCEMNVINSNFNNISNPITEDKNDIKNIYAKKIDEKSKFYKNYKNSIKSLTLDMLINQGKSFKEVNTFLKGFEK